MHKSERYSQFVFGWDWESQIDSRVNLLSPMYLYIYTAMYHKSHDKAFFKPRRSVSSAFNMDMYNLSSFPCK